MCFRTLRFCLLLYILSFLALPSLAQDTRIDALVEFIAGQNIYLNVGLSDGIAENDSLLVYREGQQLGLLLITGVTASRTVTTFAGTPFSVTRGDVLSIAILEGDESDNDVVEAIRDTLDAQPARQSVFEGGRTGSQLPPVEEGIRISGRLSLSLDVNSTQTKGLRSSVAVDRLYQIPVFNARVRVEHLPADLRLNVNTRYAHRNNDSKLGISPLNSFRAYQLNLEYDRPGSPFEARLGRFFNPAETFSGYWDGLGVSYAPERGIGAGILGGFQPTRGNEQFTTDFPKYTVFGSYAYRNLSGKTRYNANVSFHQVFPESPFLEHTFFGVSHTLNANTFRLRNLVQVDKDPRTDTWELTRLQVYSSVPVTPSFSLRGRYILRKPYNILLTENVIGYQRERITGGMSVRAFTGTFSADVSVNTSEITDKSYTYSGFASIPRLNVWDLGVSVLANYWTRDDGADVLFIVPSVSRPFGRILAQVQYHYQNSNYDVITSSNHTIEGVLNIPLGNRIRSSIRLQSRWGDFDNAFRVYTILWTRI